MLVPFFTLILVICGIRGVDAAELAFYAEPRPPVRSLEMEAWRRPFDCNGVYTRELYVAPEGDDAAGDGSQASPFATLQRAAGKASPGTRIRLGPGIFPPLGTVSNLQGAPGLPIAIVGDEKAVIDGRLAKEAMPGLHLANARYVVLENLDVRYTYPHGINIDDGGDYATPAGPVILRGVRIRDVGRGGNNDCLKLSGVDGFQVLDSEFSGCDRGEAIDMVGCHQGLISGNTFRDMPAVGVQTKGGSSDIDIRGNRFIRIGLRSVNMGGHTGAAYFRPLDAPFEAARVRVWGNIFYRSGDAAIAFTGCVDCLAVHNTIIDPQGHVARLLEEHPERAVGRNNQFINNLIAFDAGDLKGYISAGRRTRPESFVLGWNLWFARGEKGFKGPRHRRRVPPERESLLGVDPRFVDPGAGDYRLDPASPAVGRGRDIPGRKWDDYDGRWYGSPPALGAHAAP